MLSLVTARRLKEAGLEWHPALNDFFAIPEHGLDDRLFVIAEMPAAIAQLQGQTVFTFQGAVEWALDFILTTDAVWLPTEAQLRLALEDRLPEPRLSLTVTPDGYTVTLDPEGRPPAFRASAAEEAYAAALLHVLGRPPPSG
jgi:hypothetical protein